MKTTTQSFYELAVQKAVARVVSDLDAALDLEVLARNAALSVFHFHRIFRGLVGETPLALQRRLRLERAAWSLLHEPTPITTIAFAAGYESHEAFARAFRAQFACSPSEMRQRRWPEAACVTPFRFELAARSGIHFRPGPIAVPHIHLNAGEITMDVEIKEMPSLRVAVVEHVGPYNTIPEAFARLGERAAQAQLFGPDTMMLAIYHDDPEVTPAAELRSDAALVISQAMKVPDGLVEKSIPAGRYASLTHVGPYEELGDAWSRLMGVWLPQSGYRVGLGGSFEIYRNTPADVPKDKLRTELYISLA